MSSNKNNDKGHNTVNKCEINDGSEHSTFSKALTDDNSIKSHLNTSLELEGITVSEELIAKTLSRIKSQDDLKPETVQADPVKHNSTEQKVKTDKLNWFRYRYPRVLAGAAAAVIVVAVGLGYISGIGKNDYKNLSTAPIAEDSVANRSIASDEASASKEKTQDTTGSTSNTGAISPAAQEIAPIYGVESAEATDTTAEADGTAADQQDTASSENKSTSAADSEAEDTAAAKIAFADLSVANDGTKAAKSSEPVTSGNPSVTGGGDSADSQQSVASLLSDYDGNTVMTFGEIVPAPTEDISVIKITDTENNVEITLNSTEDIGEFLKLMEAQNFTVGTEAPNTCSYSVEITSLQTGEISFTMKIGDTVSVSSVNSEVASEAYYNSNDITSLKNSMKDFVDGKLGNQ